MKELANFLLQYKDDPESFVLAAFPWGEENTPLADSMPDPIQMKILRNITEQLKSGKNLETAIRVAVSSGHGIGKSALTSWLIIWFMSTRSNPQILVTAGTAAQLNTKTWRELAKWHRLAINKNWFEWTATKFYHKERQGTWFAVAQPWSENNPDAFAGTHENDVLIIFDEASSIADIIWETIEGAMTTSNAMWIVFSNPVRNSGRFFECFHKYRHRWTCYKIDSRESSLTSKKEIEQWLADYGEDSDFFRVRVRGEFPTQDDHQFINLDLVRRSTQFRAENFSHMPIIIGVDVAFKGDKSVIAVRQGRKLLLLNKYYQLNTQQLCHYISEVCNSFPGYHLFVDGVGVGQGVVDYLKSMGMRFFDVNGGVAADEPKFYLNKRAEMWGRMKKWLEDGAEIPDDDELVNDLTGIWADFNDKGQMRMEKKESMRARGLSSPDCADALSYTFFMKNIRPEGARGMGRPIAAKMDWDVFK